MNEINSVLIDLDGTMIDSISDISDAINIMLKEISLDNIPENAVKNLIGKGVDSLINKSLSFNSSEINLSKDYFTKAKNSFLRNYKIRNGNKTTVYNGVLDGLKTLKTNKIRTSVVTNKPTELAMKILRDTNLLPFFEYIICGDTCQKCKPFPDQILLACKKMNIKPQQTIFVGDSLNDVLSSKSANTAATLLVSYGYNNNSNIQAMGADVIIDNLTKVSQWVHHYNSVTL
ncbi:phosphoglycolate phosphatase [Candidatus Kinetoplastibacterium blastocrithidii TCC012E]|uniref:phosphoglycolate phosphatase n=1 Tax=Candidatus Kinetoplastidibacterium blastocrithidiae TCC012E TaxID=1208922 RepID=M1MCH0_9PROT|nr:HAD-IA family hydrolase [Candidatus Kinetoplastibacterium blastocrithidii]AFZ83397.1 phosphoglycolate phosphatase [Candidatus Kinetoplastibacterium blastocrithidii (ex Strigomonas culicis)]AGF49495.1 phosphoglycolate phosphatase [Candidatus Kinetoplastibacterium blastocrithidii TCC012E]